MLKGDIIKEMTGIDIPSEGVPSKAIWNPSDSISSSSSIASMASTNSSSSNNEATTEGKETVVEQQPATLRSSSPEAFEAALPSAGSMETNTSLRVYEDGSTEDDGMDDDDNQIGAMLTSSINTAHGSDNNSDARARKDEKKNNKLFGSTPEERQNFICSMSTLSDKQLRVQLWDSFRLARVILGKPVKDKRKLSHKSILHAIRKVAEMKIQIIRMSQELDRCRQREKKYKKIKRMPKIQQLGKENMESSGTISSPAEGESVLKCVPLAEDSASVSTSSSVFSPTSSSNGEDGPGSIPSVRDVISDSDSPDYATQKLREHAIKILQEESDLALTQIQAIDKQRNKKRRRFDDTEKLLESPPVTPPSPALFLSPSESEDDDYSYTRESATDILDAYRGKKSPYRHNQLSPILDSGLVSYESEAAEIRRVLQRVVDFETLKQPEITNGETSTTQVHQEVIALLTRLSQPRVSPASTEASSQQSPPSKAESKKFTFEESEIQHQTNVVAMDEEINNKMFSPKVPFDEPKDETSMDIVHEVEDEEIAQCRARLDAARVKEMESIEALTDLNLQKELLQGDIDNARKKTTSEREKVQLQRLLGYKEQLTTFMVQEEERRKQMEVLDVELNEMATVCVKLEDRETAFAKKHEHHLATLRDFRATTKLHTEKFRSLMGAIDRAIKEQTVLAFGGQGEDNDVNDLPPGESGSFDADANNSVQRIQKLEYLLTKQNMEVYRLKAKLKAKDGKKKEAKKKKAPSRIKW